MRRPAPADLRLALFAGACLCASLVVLFGQPSPLVVRPLVALQAGSPAPPAGRQAAPPAPSATPAGRGALPAGSAWAAGPVFDDLQTSLAPPPVRTAPATPPAPPAAPSGTGAPPSFDVPSAEAPLPMGGAAFPGGQSAMPPLRLPAPAREPAAGPSERPDHRDARDARPEAGSAPPVGGAGVAGQAPLHPSPPLERGAQDHGESRATPAAFPTPLPPRKPAPPPPAPPVRPPVAAPTRAAAAATAATVLSPASPSAPPTVRVPPKAPTATVYTVPFADGSAAVSRFGAAIVEQAAAAANAPVVLRAGPRPIDRNRALAVRAEMLMLGVSASVAAPDGQVASGEVRVEVR